jgi:hypothetical protein
VRPMVNGGLETSAPLHLSSPIRRKSFPWAEETFHRAVGVVLPPDAHTDEVFHVVIPGFDVLVANGPINSVTFLEIGLKIDVAPTVALSPPHD